MRRLIEPNSFASRLLAYMVIGVFTFLLWGIAFLLWRELYKWYLFVTEPTALFTLLVLPIPYLVYRSFMQPAGEGSPSGDLLGWAAGWLTWMGNGESYRGTLVLLVCLFWSILYWNWPEPNVQAMPLVLTFPAWGLLTIFGLILIRQMFFQQTSLPPSPEVSAGSEPRKSGR